MKLIEKLARDYVSQFIRAADRASAFEGIQVSEESTTGKAYAEGFRKAREMAMERCKSELGLWNPLTHMNGDVVVKSIYARLSSLGESNTPLLIGGDQTDAAD